MVQTTTKLMVSLSHLRAAIKFALTVAVGCSYIIKPMLDYAAAVSPRSDVLDAAVAVVFVALPLTFVTGAFLAFLYVAAPAASGWVAAMARTMASVLLGALVVFLLLVLLGSAPSTAGGGGLTPT